MTARFHLFVIPCLIWGARLFAQAPQQTLLVTNFSAPQFYPPPYQTQLKSLLQGATAQTRPNGQVLVQKAKLQTFKENGEHELIVLAPECVYDSNQRTASSAGDIRAESADGRFLTEGQGFLWRQTNSGLQTNSSLFISNNVHTVVQGDLVASPQSEAQTNKGPIDIFADRFSYESESGKGIYRDHVRVSGTNLDMSSGVMTVLVPMKERELKTIDAQNDVTINYQGVSAHGDHAVYSAATGLVDILGNPTWKAEMRDGGADKLTIDQTNQIFTAVGKAWLRMKGQKLADINGLAAQQLQNPQSNTDTNHTVTIYSDTYFIRTNAAKFEGPVLAHDAVGDSTNKTMQCQTMLVEFSGTNELQQLVADRDVVIEQEESSFTAGNAVYTGTNQLLVLTENPKWKSGLREGKGDVLRINVPENKLIADGHAQLRVPASQGGLPTEFATIAPAANDTNEFAEITCKYYELKPQEGLFRGDVILEHPRMTWWCEEVTRHGTDVGNKEQQMVARQDVKFNLISSDGEKIHGTCDQAVYNFKAEATKTNETVELTGNPMLETTNGTLRNSVIILDPLSNKIYTPGRYRMYGALSPTMTNELKIPQIRKR